MNELAFSKMHGLGNDFMVIDLITQKATLNDDQIQRWSDRRTGIGFDQLLAVEAPTDPAADFRYRIYNADGTEAENCGNGARCFAAFVRRSGLTPRSDIKLQTSTGLIEVNLLDESTAEVWMPPPGLAPEEVPFQADGQTEGPRHSLLVGDEEIEIVPVSIGNPHAVTFVNDVQRAPVERLGPQIECHPRFPERVNAGFCQVVDPRFMRLRVFERGVGETRACGTGACAAAVAAQLTGAVGNRVKVSLAGGKLIIEWNGPGQPIKMTGPVGHVYDGSLIP